MTDESNGGGGPGSPKTPVGTFLPWNGWPTSKVGYEVSPEDAKKKAKKVELARAIRALGIDPRELKDKDPAKIAEIIKSGIIREQMLENFEADAKEKGEFALYSISKDVKIKDDNGNTVTALVSSFKSGAMTVRWIENGVEKEKTLTKLSEIVSGTTEPQQQNVSSPERKRYGAKEYAVTDIIKIKSKKGDRLEDAEILSFHGDKIKVRTISADGVRVNKKISPLDIYEENSSLNQTASVEGKTSPEKKFSRHPADTILRINKVEKGHNAGKWQVKTENGWRNINTKGSLNEEELNQIRSTLKKYKNFIALRAQTWEMAEMYPELVYMKDDLLDRLDSGSFESAKTKLIELKAELEKSISAERDRRQAKKPPKYTGVSTVTTSSPVTTSPVQTSVVTTPVSSPRPTPKSSPNQLGPTDLLNDVISKDKSFWEKKAKESPEQTNEVLIRSEFIDIMDQLNRQPEYNYSVVLKKNSRTNDYYWDICVPERNFRTTKTALEKLKNSPREWRGFLYSLRDRNPENIEIKKEPTFPNDKITEDEWVGILLLLDDYKAMMTSVDVARAFPELINTKNKLLTAVDNENYNIAKAEAKKLKEGVAKATKILAGISSPSNTPASGSASGNGGAGAPPAGSGGGASVPPVPPHGAGSTPATPGQPKKKPLDIQSVWPTNISIKKEKGKSGWYVTDKNGNATRLPNNEAWGKEHANAKPVFDAYLRFINDSDVKQKNKKWELCTDLINLKNEVIDLLRNENLDAASVLREDLRVLTEKWIADWPKIYEKFTLAEDFKKQSERVADLETRLDTIKLGEADKIETKEYKEILAAYKSLILGIPADKKLSDEERNLYQAYKEIFEGFKTKVLTLEEAKRKKEGSRGSVLHPLPVNRKWRKIVNGKVLENGFMPPTKEWDDLQAANAEKIKQKKEASILKTEAELRARHEKMFQDDPKTYVALFDKKFDNPNVDSEDLVKNTADFILGKDGGALNPARKKIIDDARAELAQEESNQVKIPEKRMSGSSYTFVPTKKNMKRLDDQLHKFNDPATGKPKIFTETGKEITYNAGEFPGLVKMEKVPRTEVRVGRNPEESRIRAKHVNSVLSSLEKINLGNWKAWLAAGISGLGAVAYMGFASANENTKATTGIEATQPKESKINWRESFEKNADEADKLFLSNISDKNINNLSLIEKYIPAGKPYPDTVLSLDAHRLLYDNTSPDFEGTIDPSSKKSYRAEISKILKNAISVASYANGGIEIKPNVEEKIGDFLTRIKSMVISSDKKNS